VRGPALSGSQPPSPTAHRGEPPMRTPDPAETHRRRADPVAPAKSDHRPCLPLYMHVEGPPTPKPSIEMKGEKRRGREERGRGKRQQPLELGGEGPRRPRCNAPRVASKEREGPLACVASSCVHVLALPAPHPQFHQRLLTRPPPATNWPHSPLSRFPLHSPMALWQVSTSSSLLCKNGVPIEL
jgi:hypothetical protein